MKRSNYGGDGAKAKVIKGPKCLSILEKVSCCLRLNWWRWKGKVIYVAYNEHFGGNEWQFFFLGGGGWEGEHLGERERDDNKVFASFHGLINFRKKIYILLP